MRRRPLETAVSEWKAKRRVERLESRADDLEAYAATAVAFAWGAVDAAILDAMVARADADEAREPTKAGDR
jgi:hypothetical protein